MKNVETSGLQGHEANRPGISIKSHEQTNRARHELEFQNWFRAFSNFLGKIILGIKKERTNKQGDERTVLTPRMSAV